MSLQAILYDTEQCDAAPVAMIQESVQALEVSGNGHLLYVPPQMLPVCSPLYVNSQRVPFQISLTAQPTPVTTVPYLQLSAYLQDECGDETDARVSLLADETIHPIGRFAPQTIRDMRQTLNPDMMQTQQFDENQSPIMLYYKATTTGTITVYSSIQGDEASQVLSVPLQQFMDTCFSQDSPFPGFQSEALAGRGHGHALTAFRGLLDALDNTSSQQIDNIKSKIAREVFAEGDAVVPDVDHVANMFAGLNKQVRTRSEQGLPISFQITSSTGPQNPELLQLADQDRLPNDRPHHGRKNGHRRPKHHGIDKYLSPCEQSAALLLLALIGALIMVKMIMVRRNAQRARNVAPPMQERPVEKKNKDYVSVPTQSV